VIANVIKHRAQSAPRCARVRVSANSFFSISSCPNSPRVPFTRRDVIALNMLDLSLRVPGATGGRLRRIDWVQCWPIRGQEGTRWWPWCRLKRDDTRLQIRDMRDNPSNLNSSHWADRSSRLFRQYFNCFRGLPAAGQNAISPFISTCCAAPADMHWPIQADTRALQAWLRHQCAPCERQL